MENEKNIWKELILEFMDFARMRISDNNLTLGEWESIAKTIAEGMNLKGTTDDFARFYGKTKTNVTTVIDRKMLAKPERCLLHSFNDFQRAIPQVWKITRKRLVINAF